MVDKFRVFESSGAARAEAISLPIHSYGILGGEIDKYPRAGEPQGGPTAKNAKHRHLPPDLDAEEQEEELLRWVGLSHLPSEDDDDDTDDADDFDGSVRRPTSKHGAPWQRQQR